jgi:HEPN domain-containing protein
MNPLVHEWIQKAEADYASAWRELRARNNPNYDSACFHAQQCIEKYLKGILQSREIPFGKTHDLSVLLDISLAIAPRWESMRDDLKLLTQYAVAFRYPGESATKDEAKQAVTTAARLRAQFCSALESGGYGGGHPLPPSPPAR